MTRTAVVDASPLIFLARGGHLAILQSFYAQVIVPDSVMKELCERGPADPTRVALEGAPWIERRSTESVSVHIAAWGLGAGESAVLSLAASLRDAEAILDDQAARRCAAACEISVRGTLGMILLSKRRGMISAARPVLEDLIAGGMYLSTTTLDRALRTVGE